MVPANGLFVAHITGNLIVRDPMLDVSAMRVQNALVEASLRGAPSTAVVTTNISRLTMDVGEILLGSDPDHLAGARHRAAHTWPAIADFPAGAAAGAVTDIARSPDDDGDADRFIAANLTSPRSCCPGRSWKPSTRKTFPACATCSASSSTATAVT